MRVLLAEDDPLLGDGLRAGLRQLGFLVDWVRDGLAAESELRAHPYAAAVLDLGLPLKDGMEVLAAIRRAGLKLPVLVLTARDALPDRIRGLDVGADDYVVKPVDLNELAARLRALVRRAHGQAQDMPDGAGRGAGPGGPLRATGGRRRWPCRRANSTCCTRCCSTPAACCRASSWSSICTAGGRRSTAMPSRCMCTTCGASWAAR